MQALQTLLSEQLRFGEETKSESLLQMLYVDDGSVLKGMQ